MSFNSVSWMLYAILGRPNVKLTNQGFLLSRALTHVNQMHLESAERFNQIDTPLSYISKIYIREELNMERLSMLYDSIHGQEFVQHCNKFFVDINMINISDMLLAIKADQ